MLVQENEETMVLKERLVISEIKGNLFVWSYVTFLVLLGEMSHHLHDTDI